MTARRASLSLLYDRDARLFWPLPPWLRPRHKHRACADGSEVATSFRPGRRQELYGPGETVMKPASAADIRTDLDWMQALLLEGDSAFIAMLYAKSLWMVADQPAVGGGPMRETAPWPCSTLTGCRRRRDPLRGRLGAFPSPGAAPHLAAAHLALRRRFIPGAPPAARRSRGCDRATHRRPPGRPRRCRIPLPLRHGGDELQSAAWHGNRGSDSRRWDRPDHGGSGRRQICPSLDRTSCGARGSGGARQLRLEPCRRSSMPWSRQPATRALSSWRLTDSLPFPLDPGLAPG